MATRRETSARRQVLADSIRAQCQAGELRSGDMVPTVRELQETHGLSARIVHEELRKLVADGLLVSRPRVGIFVADREPTHPDNYLMVMPVDREPFASPEMFDRVRVGFEDQVTELGGASAVIAIGAPGSGAKVDHVPDVSGIFAAGAKDAGELRGVVPDGVPRVRWLTMPTDSGVAGPRDTVAPDHVGAGRRAAEHLIRRGHRRIGFFGVHTGEDKGLQLNHFSSLCESGWQEALAEHGVDPSRLVFRVTEENDRADELLAITTVAARPIVARRDITSVVCASTKAAEGLVAALREAGVPSDAWPALVTVGHAVPPVSAFTTGIRIPHEELGREAARILWRRVHGELTGDSRHFVVPMPIVRRMDGAPAWLDLAGRGL